MNRFDRPALDTLREEMNAALAQVAARHNLEFHLGNIRFTPEEARFVNFSVKIAGARGRDERKSDALLENQMQIHKLAKVNSKGDELLGYNTRRPRYPFTYKNALDRKTYKCDLSFAKKLFAISTSV